MTESVYKIIEVVGSSPDSWEEAAKAAVEAAGKSLKDLRVAEIAERVGAPERIEIVDVELKGAGHRRLLRIYIDRPEGATGKGSWLDSRKASSSSNRPRASPCVSLSTTSSGRT